MNYIRLTTAHVKKIDKGVYFFSIVSKSSFKNRMIIVGKYI